MAGRHHRAFETRARWRPATSGITARGSRIDAGRPRWSGSRARRARVPLIRIKAATDIFLSLACMEARNTVISIGRSVVEEWGLSAHKRFGVLPVTGSKGSRTSASSFSGLFTRVEIGHIIISSAG